MAIFDNVNNKLIDDLKKEIKPGAKLSIAAACFSIYAFQALKEELEQIDELRFIFTSPTFVSDQEHKELREFYIPRLNRERSLLHFPQFFTYTALKITIVRMISSSFFCGIAP